MSWTNDFFRRLAMIEGWVSDGAPTTFWLSGFFFPQGFMTAVKQTYSRNTHIPVDTLEVRTIVTTKSREDVDGNPPNGVYVDGMYMQGARFDRATLLMAASRPGVLFDEVPVVHFEPRVIPAELEGEDTCTCVRCIKRRCGKERSRRRGTARTMLRRLRSAATRSRACGYEMVLQCCACWTTSDSVGTCIWFKVPFNNTSQHSHVTTKPLRPCDKQHLHLMV